MKDQNFQILVTKPLYLSNISICVLCVGFILIFFGYQYLKDPPQGAYIERIVFLFLVFCTIEILHAWSFVQSIEWGAFAQAIDFGQYVSAVVLFFILVFFSLRLRFINSVSGEFYEQELDASPSGVVRWRDALDNYVIKHFLDPRVLPKRILALPKAGTRSRKEN